MSDIQMVRNMLIGILNPDNSARNEATNKYNELKQNPTGLIICLTECMRGIRFFNLDNEKQVKILSSVLIRRLLDIENTDDDKQIWRKISQEMKTQIKVNVLKAMVSETERFTKMKIADTLGRISENVLENSEDWPEILTFINEVFAQKENVDTSLAESALTVFCDIFKYLSDKLVKNLQTVLAAFSSYLNMSDMNLRTKTVTTIGVIITYSKKKYSKFFQDFILSILSTTNLCLQDPKQENNLRINLTAINEILEKNHNLFTPNLQDFYKFILMVVEKKDFVDGNIRELGFDIIMNVLNKNKSKFENEVTLLRDISERLFKYALDIDKEIPNDWTNPQVDHYFDYEEHKEEQVEFAVTTIERLIRIFDKKKMMALISDAVMTLLKETGDWRYKYVALMTISEIAEHIDDNSGLDNILDIIISHLKNENPKIRFSAIECLRQLAEKIKNEFQTMYHQKVIPSLLESLKDTILRNQLHTLDALEYFMEFIDQKTIAPYIQPILDSVFVYFMKEDIPASLRFSILATISELADAAKDSFKPYSEKCIEVLFNFFVNIYSKKIYGNLYGKLLETMTLIGETNEDHFTKYVPDIVTAVVEIQKNLAPSDFSFEYFVNSLERLCPIVKDKFKNLVPMIIEAVMKLVVIDPKMSVSTNPENAFKIEDVLSDLASTSGKKKEEFNLQTTEVEEKETALQLLHSVLLTFSELFIPYLEIIHNILLPIIHFKSNSSIRSEVSNILPVIMKIVKENSSINEAHNIGKLYINELFKAMEFETNNATLAVQLDNSSEIIETIGVFLTTPELNAFFDKILFFFSETEKRRRDLNKEKEENSELQNDIKKKGTEDEEDIGEFDDIDEALSEEIEEIENVLVAISELIGALFKTHKSLTLEIVNKITTIVLPNYLKEGASNFEIKMGLYIIDDLIEFLGQEILSQDLWNNLAHLVIKFCDSEEPGIRQAASYGIGNLAVHTKTGFNHFINECLTALDKGMQINSDGVDDEEWGYARDNLIASLGKIIRHHSNLININELVPKWINNLPITYDTREAQLQHTMLMEMILSNSQLVFGQNYINLPKVLRICGKIYKSEKSTEGCDNYIESIFTNLINNNDTKEFVIKAENDSEEKMKRKIGLILNAVKAKQK